MKKILNYAKTTNRLTLAVILTYILLLIVRSVISLPVIDYLLSLLGLLLLFYIPGLNINNIIGINRSIGPLPKISLAITSSFVTVGFFLLLTRSIVGFSPLFNVILILVVCSILYLASYFSGRSGQPQNKLQKFDYFSLIALIPALLFIVRSIINPYLVDQDGEKYVYIMNKIVEFKADGSFLSTARYLFSQLVVSTHYITNISFLDLFKFVFPFIVWLTFPVILALKDSKNRIIYALPLLLLISPSITGHIDRFKPESITIMLAAPAMIFFVKSLKENSLKFYLFGLISALVATRCHETGMIFLASYLLSGILLIKKNWPAIKPYLTIKNIAIALIIIIPYLILLHIGQTIGGFVETISSVADVEKPIHFRAWFLDHFISKGANLSWPGITFIYYYLFNGIAIIVISLIALLYKKRLGTKGYALPAVIGTLFFLITAEVLPRFGIYFLPDRSIVQLFLYAFLVVCIYYSMNEKFRALLHNKIIAILLLVNIAGGIGISLYLQLNSGSLVSKEEAGVMDYIENSTSKDSVVMSTQKLNSALVEIYGKREFVNITLPKHFDNNPSSEVLSKLIKVEIGSGSISLTNNSFPDYMIRRTTTTDTEKSNVFSEGIYLKVIERTHTVEKDKSTLLNANRAIESRPVYLLYSFTKVSGALQKSGRQYLTSALDSSNLKYFEQLSGDEIVYKDASSILIRVQ